MDVNSALLVYQFFRMYPIKGSDVSCFLFVLIVWDLDDESVIGFTTNGQQIKEKNF